MLTRRSFLQLIGLGTLGGTAVLAKGGGVSWQQETPLVLAAKVELPAVSILGGFIAAATGLWAQGTIEAKHPSAQPA